MLAPVCEFRFVDLTTRFCVFILRSAMDRVAEQIDSQGEVEGAEGRAACKGNDRKECHPDPIKQCGSETQ
jgi:hypothetical protein